MGKWKVKYFELLNATRLRELEQGENYISHVNRQTAPWQAFDPGPWHWYRTQMWRTK